MELKDEIKGYITTSGWTLTKLTEALNIKNNTDLTVQNLSNKIRKDSLKYTDILDIAEIIGYDIKWLKK